MARKLPSTDLERGRPVIEIDWTVVDRLLHAGCNGTEVAAFIGCCADTLYQRCLQEKGMIFSAYLRLKKEKGDAMLLAKQFEKAVIKGDNSMLIWLGKQRKGQRDAPDVSLDATVKTKLEELNEWTKSENESTQVKGDTEQPVQS